MKKKSRLQKDFNLFFYDYSRVLNIFQKSTEKNKWPLFPNSITPPTKYTRMPRTAAILGLYLLACAVLILVMFAVLRLHSETLLAAITRVENRIAPLTNGMDMIAVALIEEEDRLAEIRRMVERNNRT